MPARALIPVAAAVSPFAGAPRRHRFGLRLVILLAIGTVIGWLAWPRVRPVLAETIGLRLAIKRVEKHRDVIEIAAAESGVDPYLLAGVMLAESSGRVGVRSKKGALGLLQLSPVTAAERARKLDLPEPTEEQLLTDPLLNVRLGANYLAWLLDRHPDNLEAALIAYNLGPTRLNRFIVEAGGYAAWREARLDSGDSELLKYAAKVMKYRDVFVERKLFEPESSPSHG